MVSRTRLPRGKSSKPNGRLRTQISSELKALPTARVKRYASLTDNVVASSPVLALTRDVAKSELETRAKMLGTWKPKGMSKAEVAKKVLEFGQRGAQEFGKVITGVKAQELEEAIATAGLKPEEKKKVLAELQKERVESIELFPMRQKEVEPEVFSISKASDEMSKELKAARKEALG